MATYRTGIDLGILGEVEARVRFEHEAADPSIGFPEYIEVTAILVRVHESGDLIGHEVDILSWMRQLGGDSVIDALEAEILEYYRLEAAS